ncbi:MAG TPA: LysE family transporter [Sedimentisphaerales bacterium]|nr:LysE family transporter [Sedimentisphaerales bacterium]
MAFLFFLAQVLIISCSGAMQPGPVTAAAIAMGARNRWAGTLLAIGHGIIEFPLMVLIIFGLGKYFELQKVQIAIGLAGGAFLLLMAIQGLLSLKAKAENKSRVFTNKPVLAGIILSAGNPYFLLWWATVGLALATQATQWGIWAFALFALTHWSVDLIWLQILSWASSKGSVLLGPRGMRIVLMICSAALLVFGLFFVYNAGSTLIRLILTKN